MESSKYLAKNVGLLTISQFGTKLLTFFLVPLYTNILTTGEYGTYDLFSTTVGLLIPIFTLNIVESVLRFSLDKNNNLNNIFSIGIKYTVLGTSLTIVFVVMNHFLNVLPTLNIYWYYLPILFFVTVLNTLFTYFSRAIDKVKETAISGGLCSIVMIGFNIVFLLVLKIGLHGYFLAQILSMLIQVIYLLCACKIWNYIDGEKDSQLEKGMKSYSTPMIANSISWWVNNSSDRYIVTFICGISTNGIYSVAYKIPSILNVFQNIFFQAWTLSAVKYFDAEDKDGFFSSIYALYNCVMTVICSCLIAFTKIFARILYAKDFYVAWKYVPFLTIAIVFGSMSGFLGAIFSAVKDTKAYARTTTIGALVNTILNIILVVMYGPNGAAISTAMSYCLVWIMRLKQVKRYIKIRISYFRDILSYLVLTVQAIFLYLIKDNVILYLVEGLLVILVIFLYREQILTVIKKKDKFRY